MNHSEVTASPSTPLCITCGYDLGGLDPAGVCPECATPIEHSRRGPLLRDEHPGWLHSVTRGVTMLRWGVRLMGWGALSLLLFFIAFMSIGLLIGGGALQHVAGWVLLVSMIGLGGSACVLLIAGGWFMTALKPSGTSPLDPYRAPLRWTAWSPIAILGVWLYEPTKAPSPASIAVQAGLIGIVVISFLVYRWCLLSALQILTARVRSAQLFPSQMLRRVRRETIVFAAVFALPFVSMFAPGPMPADAAEGLALLCAMIAVFTLGSPLRLTLAGLHAEVEAAQSAVSTPVTPVAQPDR